MKKNVVVGVLVILVLLLAIAAEVFYLLKARPRVSLELQGFTEEEKEVADVTVTVRARQNVDQKTVKLSQLFSIFDLPREIN